MRWTAASLAPTAPSLAPAMAPRALALALLPQATLPASSVRATTLPRPTLPASHVQEPTILLRQLSYASLPPKSASKRVISIWLQENLLKKMPFALTSTALVGRSPLSPAPISRDFFSPTPSALATCPSSWICRLTSFVWVARFWPTTPTPMTPAPTFLGCLARLPWRHRRPRPLSPGSPAALLLVPPR